MARGRGQDRSGHWALAFVFSDFWSREQVEGRAGPRRCLRDKDRHSSRRGSSWRSKPRRDFNEQLHKMALQNCLFCGVLSQFSVGGGATVRSAHASREAITRSDPSPVGRGDPHPSHVLKRQKIAGNAQDCLPSTFQYADPHWRRENTDHVRAPLCQGPISLN